MKYPLLLTALAVATTASAAPEKEKVETVIVKGSRAQFELPTKPDKTPSRPDLKLKLPAYQLDSVDYNFPSGLRIIFQSDHSQPVVAVTTVYDRGSTSDPLTKEGIAHFVEHLWFRSQHINTQTGTRLPKVWDILSDLGCDLNASTADDWTNYMSVCPATSLPGLLRLESLRLTNAVEGVEPSVVDTEREVIRNELRMRYENDWALILPYLFEHLYPDGHPYERLGIGSHESLANVKLEDIQAFVDTNYVPANTTIVVVGAFDLADVPELIYDNFDFALLDSRITEKDIRRAPRRGVENPDPKKPEDWFMVPMDPTDNSRPLSVANKPPVRIDGPRSEPPAPKDQIMGRHKAATEDPMVVIAWTVPGAYRGDDLLWNIMANVAGSYIQSYFRTADLPVKWREVGCFTWQSKIDSKLICAIPTTTADVKPEQIAQRAVDQIAFMWDADYNYDPNNNIRYIDTALSRVRMEFLASTLQSLDLFATVGGGRATDIAHHAHFTGSHQMHSDAMREAMALKGDDIAKLAFKYLRRDRVTNVFLEPLPKDEILADASSSSAYHGAQGGDDVVRSTIDPKQVTAEVIKDLTITPDISSLIDKTLPNGLRVVVLSHGEAPSVEAGLLFYGGTGTGPYPGFDEFAETFSTATWNQLTPVNDPLQVAGSWKHDEASNYTYHSIQAASGNLDGALWMLREAVDSIKPDMEGRTDWTKDGFAHLKKDWKFRDGYYDAGFVTRTRLDQINPGHPLSWHWSWEDYTASKAWTGKMVGDYLNEKYQPANAVLVIVGNVDDQQAAALAEYYLQGWAPRANVKIGQQPNLPAPNPPVGEPRVVVFDDKQKTQTDVTFACQMAPSTQENDVIRGVLTDYLDEQAWIILRENGGVTYGAGAQARGQPGGTGLLFMNSLVQNDGVPLAVNTFFQLAKEAEAGKFDEDRVQIHKFNRAKKYVLYQQSVPQMLSRLTGQLYWRNDWALVNGFADRLAVVDGKALQAQMGTCSQHAIITVEGPKDNITPMLDAAGIKYEVFDWQQAGKDLLKKHDPKAAEKAEKAEAKQKAEDEKKGKTEGGETP